MLFKFIVPLKQLFTKKFFKMGKIINNLEKFIYEHHHNPL